MPGVAAPTPVDLLPVQDVDNKPVVMPTKQIVIPTPQQVPEVLIEEVVQSLQPMLVEQVEVEEDAPRFEQSERLDSLTSCVKRCDCWMTWSLARRVFGSCGLYHVERDVYTGCTVPGRRADSDGCPSTG